MAAKVGYAVAMLALFLLACADPDCGMDAVDSASGDTAQDGAGQYADANGDGLPDMWDDPAYWAADPLAPIMLPTEFPEREHWEIRLATSPDRKTWTADPRVVAYGMSTLDMFVAGDWLVISGMIGPVELSEHPEMTGGESVIAAMATNDLQTWGSTTWGIHDQSESFIVDPALSLGSNGVVQASWYGHSEGGVDPAQIEGPHGVQRATWTDENGFVQNDVPPEYAAELLADPVICEMAGESWLFHTEDATRVLAAVSSDGGESFESFDGFEWEGPSVPHCTSGDDSIRLVAQRFGGAELPATGEWHTDRSFVDTGFLYNQHLYGENCTSPVMGWHKDQWVLACAVNVRLELE